MNVNIKHLKGDFIGGLTASLLPFPRAIALGALVFSPLGEEYIPFGIVAGLISLFIANVIAAPIGKLHIMTTAPFSLSSFMLLGATTVSVQHLEGVLGTDELAVATLGLVFLTVSISGIIQTLFGLLRLGGAAKYIPYPVLAGLLNGSALLIILSQVPVMLGAPIHMTLSDILDSPSIIQPLTLIVGSITCIATWISQKSSSGIPAPVIGISIGTIAYVILVHLGFSNELGATVGAIPAAFPTPQFIDDFYLIVSDVRLEALVLDLIPFAFGMAIIDSLRSLLVCAVGESCTLQRINSNQELVAQGMGNMLNGLFGGISTTGCLTSTLTNHKYGGRTAFSRFFTGLFPLSVLLLLSPLVAKIPYVVLGGVLIITSLESLNKWSLSLPLQIKKALQRQDPEPLIDFSLVLLVMGFLMTFGILLALGVGLFISLTWFVIRMSKSGIYRFSQGDIKRSNTTRNQKELDFLEKVGDRIKILELDGPLFFGTADKLAAHIDSLLEGDVQFIILDFSRITSVDTTGGQILQQSINKCFAKNVSLYLSGIKVDSASAHKELARNISLFGEKKNCFVSLEVAMAVAEDRLLDMFIGDNRYFKEIPLSEVTTFRLMTPQELSTIRLYLKLQTYPPKSTIFSKNEQSSTVYFLVKGRARVTQPGWDAEYERLATMSPGATFGEMSLLDGLPRSADVQTGQMETSCYLLTLESLSKLTREHPSISHKLILGLGIELSTRLRVKNISVSS